MSEKPRESIYFPYLAAYFVQDGIRLVIPSYQVNTVASTSLRDSKPFWLDLYRSLFYVPAVIGS